MDDGGLQGRDEELTRITAALLDGGRGVLLVGPAGVGKSRLATEVGRVGAEGGLVVVPVTATPGAAVLPLGSMAPLLPADAAASGLPVLPVLREVIKERADGRRAVLSVDDAQYLDEASATLVHQLVTAGDVALVATQRTGTIAPDPVARLWQDGVVERLDLSPLDRDALERMAAGIVGSPLDPTSADLVWDLTQGNALFTREVLLAVREAGALTITHGEAHLDQLPADAPRLVDFVRHRIGHLERDLSEALLLVAVGEPLGPGELPERVDAEVLARLDAAEVIRTEPDERRLVIGLTHSLFGEVLRAAAGPLQLRRARRELAEALAATGARRRYDTLRLATWSLSAGLPLDPEVLRRAARTARFTRELDLARDLSEAAWAEQPDFDTGDLLADVLYEIGDAAAVVEHRSAWEAVATTADERIRIEINAAITRYWRLGDAPAAWQALDAADAEPASDWRDEARAVRATLLSVSGEADAAWELAEPLLERDPDRVLIQAALAALHSLRALGRPLDAVAICDQALAAYEFLGEQVSMFTARVLGSGRALALAHAGLLDDAEAETARTVELCRSEREDSGLGLSSMVLAWVAIVRGRLVSALRHLNVADNAFTALRHLGMRRWALAGMALAHAMRGDVASARTALERHDELPDHPALVFDSVLVRARAWLAFAEGMPVDAREELIEGAARCRSRGDLSGEADCLYDLARLGRAEDAVDRMVEICEGGQGSLLQAMAGHARALGTADTAELAAAAEELAGIGAMLWAAEAGFAAAEAARRDGDPRLAAQWSRSAAEWRDACESPSTPGLVADLGPVPLTRREREVAMLAAQGLAAREIGERLFVSRRTVESHLARVYDKLGIRSRAELARIFDEDRSFTEDSV